MCPTSDCGDNYQFLFFYEKMTPGDFWILERKEFPLFAKVSLRLCKCGTKGQVPPKNRKIKKRHCQKISENAHDG